MTKLKEARSNYFNALNYQFIYWEDWHYIPLQNVWFVNTSGKRRKCINDVIIMADTETSKSFHEDENVHYFDYEYDDIKRRVSTCKLKYRKEFSEVATFRELKSAGFNFAYKHNFGIDTLYQEFQLTYPYLFPEEAYSDIHCVEYIYDYLINNKPSSERKKNPNYVVAWTISIRCFNKNLVTLWGRKPSDLIKCLTKIHNKMNGNTTYVYFHNLTYDYTFLRQFMFAQWNYPIHQLNTKPRYPIYIEFGNGIILRDSLILAQRKLEKWADDLDVEHKKAVGKWDYEKIRTQDEDYTPEELEYIEHDTLAGVECIQKTMDTLNKQIQHMPYTATGIPREQTRKLGKAVKYKDNFNRMCLSYEQYLKMVRVYHGGYTHGNRHYIGILMQAKLKEEAIKCYDFASSYPFCMLAYKFPMEKFMPQPACTVGHILKNKDRRAYIFKLILKRPSLKNDEIPMPALQFSKCRRTINEVLDNGRILAADYVEIYLNEIDLIQIEKQYNYDEAYCVEVESALKDYLPRWFTDYVFKCFVDKTKLKGGDPVLYSIAKSKLNSLYGMTVQKSLKSNWQEDFENYEYYIEEVDEREEYDKYLNNRNNILPYQWGVWVTSYAQNNLFKLGECFETWLYSDTDSCYGIGVDQQKIDAYNQNCIDLLKANRYEGVWFNDRWYYLGIAEHEPEDDTYEEFKYLGAKRYCGRNFYSHKLKITVAGVPKKNGVKCLDDDINQFKAGKIFDGYITGKKTHEYIAEDSIKYVNGIEYADSINLIPCDYLMSSIAIHEPWEYIFKDYEEVVSYDVEENE